MLVHSEYPKQTSVNVHPARLLLFNQLLMLVRQTRSMRIQIQTACPMDGRFGLHVGTSLMMDGRSILSTHPTDGKMQMMTEWQIGKNTTPSPQNILRVTKTGLLRSGLSQRLAQHLRCNNGQETLLSSPLARSSLLIR